uniref:Protein regulator of cytokinesis 1 n=1 Tax=Caenorhabditis tropicalis TaxID=1561998 RepID=A0A1I7T548_9PELO
MSRRHSIVDAYSTLETKIRDTMRELSSLWDEVDMSESMRLNRFDSAFTHITLLCDDMLNGEKDMVESLKISIREDMKSVKKMRVELEMEEYQRPADIKDGSIALRRHLQAEVKQLEIEFQKRHEDQKNLIEKICNLKVRLNSDFDFEYEIHALFPQAAFQKYSDQCKAMEETLRTRYTQIEQFQSDLKQWKSMAQNVSDYIDNDEDLKELLEKNVDSEDFVFSESILDALGKYHEEMKQLYDHWLSNIEFRWTEQFLMIEDQWNKCMVPAAERHFSPVFEPSKNSEQILARMAEECARLEKKYESCRVVYELVEKWKAVWSEKLGIDEKRKQPDYYKKVNVLPDNKRERELLARMPVLEREIQATYLKHMEENEDDQITIQGMEPLNYIRFIQEEHKRELKFELQLKKEEKTRLQSPTPTRTPRTQKRTMFKTPLNTKMEPVAKKLNFDTDLPPCMSPATSEMISFITPTRRQPAGPKTSSPKEQTPLSRTTTPMSKRAMTPSSMASGSSSSAKKPLARRNFL